MIHVWQTIRWTTAVALLLGPVLPDGYAEGGEKRYVIIHADDAGMCHSVNRATVDALERGTVSSASIMVPCPWFSEFAAYAAAHPEADFGIHLTLNAEWNHYRWGPVSPRDKVPSLVDEHGYLWSNVGQVVAHAKAEEVELELRAQIERALSFGVPVTHLDPHMGAVVSRPDLARIYIKLGLEYKIPVLFVRAKPGDEIARRYPGVIKMAKQLEQQGMPVLDAMYQFYTRGTLQSRREKYLDTLRSLPPGVSEIIIHCGYNDEELRAVTSSAPIRDTDRAIFMDPDVVKEIKEMNIEVIGWKDFQQLRFDRDPSGIPASDGKP